MSSMKAAYGGCYCLTPHMGKLYKPDYMTGLPFALSNGGVEHSVTEYQSLDRLVLLARRVRGV